MKKKNATEALKEAIILLEEKQIAELIQLREQVNFTLESLKPVNLIKNAISEISVSDVKNALINNAIGLTTGYLSKKVLLGSSQSPVKKVLGTILQFAVAGSVSKHTDVIKSAGENLFRSIFKRKEKQTVHQEFPGSEN